MKRVEVPVAEISVGAYRVPTDYPESDGTLEWNATTMIVVKAVGGNQRGIGYTYADTSTALLIKDLLAGVVTGRDAFDVGASWRAMVVAIRNLGRPGIASMAIAAVDSALWDLKARLLNIALIDLLGGVHPNIRVYGSGGFTSYDCARLCRQLEGWADQGIGRVKMKIGREPSKDVDRVAAARRSIGPDVELFVDANGAYQRKQALWFARLFADLGVTWFEEPVTSDDIGGLRLIRDRAPAGLQIAAGEYGYAGSYFRRMLEAGAVDVLQVDASRCAGITGFIQAAALCEAHSLPLSAHCCPALHLHLCCAAQSAIHLEYFHDHVRIEQMFFDGVAFPQGGVLTPDRTRPGMGLEFRESDAARFAV